MRRFAGRFAALVLALLMLLSSMPLTALAEQVEASGVFSIDVQSNAQPDANTPKTAEELAREAIDETAENNTSLIVSGADAPVAPVSTGDSFSYTIGVQYDAAATYVDPDSNAVVRAYDEYTDIELTVEAPENIVLLVNGQEYKTYTYTAADISALADRDVSNGGASEFFTIQARMTNNGVAKDGSTYGPLEITIKGKITSVFGDHTRELTYTIAEGDNRSSATNSASADWKVTKTMPDTGAFVKNEDDTVTVTWNINVDRKDKNPGSTGTLNFADDGFKLTDTLPEVNGKSPTSAKLSLINADGTAGKVLSESEDGNKTISTTTYNTTTFVDYTQNSTTQYTPDNTSYRVEAVYPRDAFEIPWTAEDVTVEDYFLVENTATLDYTLVNKTTHKSTDTAEGRYGIETPDATLIIVEKLNIGGTNEVDYTSYYEQAFPEPENSDGTEGVQFEVYKQSGNDYVLVDTVEVDVTTNGASVTITGLEPGVNYQIKQISHPVGSDPLTGDDTKQTVHIAADETKTVTFINTTPAKRILTIEKRDTSGKLIESTDENARATFKIEVKSPTDTSFVSYEDTITVNADGRKVLAINVSSTADTTVTITETRAPDGYIKSTETKVHTFTHSDTGEALEKTFTFTNHETVTGTLTLTKQLLGANGTTSLPFADGDSFTFTLLQKSGTEGKYVPYNNGSGISDGKITISNADAVTISISGLPVATDAGVPYYYEIVEDALPTDFAFHRVKVGEYELEKSSYEFDFWDEDNNRPASALTASVIFQNKLTKSDLTIKKLEKTLTSPKGTPKEGVTFELYESVPGGTGSANPVKETETTNTEGLATFENLDIYDANGGLKQYYIKETNVSDDYTVTYPDTNEGQDYWGPITLAENARVTNLTSTPVTNTKQEISLTIKKVDNNNAAKAGAEFTVEKQNGDAWEKIGTFTTDTDGTVAVTVDDGLKPGTYHITETTVPAGLLPTGSVSQTGVDASDFKSDTTNSQLTAVITIDALEKPTVTFKNDIKPTLTVTKTVDGTVQTAKDFTFTLYTKDGENAYTPVKNADNQTITFTNGDTITLEVDKVYAVKETGFPAGVVAPADEYIAINSGETTQANRNYTLTIDNTSSYATLTLKKQDSKTQEFLTGAKVEIKVTNKNLTEEDEALLVAAGFKDANGDFAAAQTVTIDNASGKSVSLPAFLRNGETMVIYTIQETEAPTGYLLDKTLESVDITLVGEGDAASQPTDKEHTFTNAPEATLTVTKTYYKQWEAETNNQRFYTLDGAVLALFELDGSGDSATLKQVG